MGGAREPRPLLFYGAKPWSVGFAINPTILQRLRHRFWGVGGYRVASLPTIYKAYRAVSEARAVAKRRPRNIWAVGEAETVGSCTHVGNKSSGDAHPN